MLHNLFHSLPCTHSGSKSPHPADMTRTTKYVEPIFEYSLPALTNTPSFLLRYLAFFWYHRFNAYTHSLSQKFILSESLISRPVFSLLLPVYLLSSLHFLFLYTYISTYHWYLRICEFFLFLIYKIPLRSLLFWNRHICGYCFYFFFTFLTSYHPFFFIMNRLSFC